jgi:hypothetical protein
VAQSVLGWPLAASRRAPPERPVLLAVDQQLGEGATLWVAPELADPVGSLEVREHQDVEQLGAGGWRQCLEALSQDLLHLLEDHEWSLRITEGTSPRTPPVRDWCSCHQ